MNPLIIHTEGQGKLAVDCSAGDVKAVVQEIVTSKHAVFHFHGGLVNEKTGRELAGRLDTYYRAAGLLPVFFVWETGPFETISNNISRIAKEDIFQTILKKVLRHVAGKVLLDSPGAKAPLDQCPLPSPVQVQTELQKRSAQIEPFAQKPNEIVANVTTAELERFEQELANDDNFNANVAAILKGLDVSPPLGAKSPAFPVVAVRTEISTKITTELKEKAQAPGGKGLLETGVLIKHAAAILIRVVKRFVMKRGHGIYTTVVEELLRELYLGSVGSVLWGSMKDDARDNFAEPDNGKLHGGNFLLSELSAALKVRSEAGLTIPKISIVGHSAGTIFACEMLKHIAKTSSFLCLHRLAFLAAACRCDVFAPVLDEHGKKPLWNRFRAFAFREEREAGYWQIPVLYPRSLLYLVCGLGETDGGESAFDMPLMGMERYVKWAGIYDQPAVLKIRTYLDSSDDLTVWALENSGPGRNSDAVRHGGFDDTAGDNVSTMASVVHFLTT